MSNQTSSASSENFLASKKNAFNTTTAKKEDGPASQTITRTLHVHIEGSLEELGHQGPEAGLWKGSSGREGHMFHPNLDDNMDTEKSNSIVNSLRNAVVKRLTVKEHQSTFPYTLGININCVPPTEVTNIGEKFTYTVLPNSVINTPQLLYQCDGATEDRSNWQQLYSKWNSVNLENEGTIDVPNASYLFVHMDHPVIGVLRFNQQLIGCDIDSQKKLENEYFRVSKQVMKTCCDTIRDDVLSKMSTKDLNYFTLQARKLNNAPWEDPDHVSLLGFKPDPKDTPEVQDEKKAAHVKHFMTTPYSYTARLEIEYEIPTL